MDLNYLKTNFNSDFVKIFLNEVETFIKQEHVIAKNTTYTLTEKGKLLADKIASELFV